MINATFRNPAALGPMRPNRLPKVYANRAHLAPVRDRYLNPLLHAVWKQGIGSTASANRHHDPIPLFATAEAPCEADLYVLPLTWNFYVDNDQIGLAADEAERARRVNRRLIIFSEGDFTAHVPFSNSVIFERSAYRSRRSLDGNQVFALPSFISDYLQIYLGNNLHVRSKREKPVVGFCGQADESWFHSTRRGIACLCRKLAYRLQLRKWEPPPFETARWRYQILRLIERDKRIHVNFLMRGMYRAGYRPKVKDPFHPTRLEFVKNILDSDYTVCMRGGGNFSVRLYETLSLGRIPVFVDTDCVLPFDQAVDWRKCCVWVQESELSRIAQSIREFHDRLTDDDFKRQQQDCRRFWLEWLSHDGFWRRFHEQFPAWAIAADDGRSSDGKPALR